MAELLDHVLETRFTQGVYSDLASLERFLRHPAFPNRYREFKEELADAIRNHRVTPEHFERLTAVDRDSQADVDAFLLNELWIPLFGSDELP